MYNSRSKMTLISFRKGWLLSPLISAMAVFILFIPATTNAAWFENRPVIGSVENVGLDEADTILKARIDTGAGLASINAEVVEIKKVIGTDKERVVFRVTDKNGKSKTLERPIVEWVNIKKKGDSGSLRRPVVKLDLCLGGKKVEVRANLADRSKFLYPVLIGRNVLITGDYIIDPKLKFTHEPGCK